MYQNMKTASAVLLALLMSVGTSAFYSLDAFPKADAADQGLYGDLNGDGLIDGADSALLRAYLAGQISVFPYDSALQAADVTGDQAVTTDDAAMLKAYLLRKRNGFAAGVSFEIQQKPDYYFAVDAEYGQAVREDLNSGFAGEAYVNYDNVIGSYINWTVNVPSAGNYRVTFRYANGVETDRPCKVTVNGSTDYAKVSYPSTGSWTTWAESSVVVTLQAGQNTIRATASTESGGPNMDYLILEPTTEPAAALTEEIPEGAQQVEDLDRGVIAAKSGNDKGMLISWRLLGTDNENTSFKVFRNGDPTVLYEGTAADATCYYDPEGTASDWYTVDVYQGEVCTEFACLATMLGSKDSSGAYVDLNFTAPSDLTMPDGSTCSYTVNDCSVGDADGDGQYELFVKWDPSNSQDNSKGGYTGNVYLDCYKLNGTRLWRVDLGVNIRAGAHYTQFMVYDYDGDGRAEMICKTSDGTVDGTGTVIGNASADYRASSGYILSGNEYLTLFDGLTGKALDTVDYIPGRGTVSSWGDTYGNRVDRFLAATAYLNGTTPSCVMIRGCYTRMTAAAYNVVDKKLVHLWTFDSGTAESTTSGYGDGNHNCFAADCDNDGKDEIVMGSAVIDDNGKLLYTTGRRHGDVLHVGDLVPGNPGLEIFMCHEASPYGFSLRDAATGRIILQKTGSSDTGRGLADNLVAGNDSAEFVGVQDSLVYDASGNTVCSWSDITKWGMNSVVYWTGSLERAVLDRTMVDQYGSGRVFTGSNVTYNNSSKSNACLTCDLFGDWREEMIFRLGTGSGVRIYSTTYETEYGIVSLMHNVQYRTAVAGQNVAYNQPPHTDYFLGTGYPLPERPNVYAAKAEN